MTSLSVYGQLLGWIPWWVWLPLILAVVLYLAFIWSRARGYSGRGTLQQQRDRSPQWAASRDVETLVIRQSDPRRLPLGELSTTRRPEMLACPVGGSKMVVAPAGAGKTARVLVPDLLQHRGPVVSTSVKTDVLWLTLQRRAQQGPIWVLNPSESAGLGTCRFSPLMGIKSFDDALRTGQWLSDAGHDLDGGIKGQEFWDSLARRMLAPALFLAARENYNLDDVFGWVQQRSEEFVTQRLDNLGDQRAIRAWAAHRNTHEKTKSSIVDTAYNILEGWSSEVMAKVTDTRNATGNDLLDIDRLLDARGTLYLIASNADQHIYRAVFESVINAIVRRVQEREEASGRPLRPSLLLSLDEAANIAPLRDLGHIVSSGRGQGLLVASVWQDLAQVRRIYGEAAEEVKSNHIAKMYMKGISDVGTLNELSTLLGKTIRSTINHSRDVNEHRSTVSMSEDEVDLATPGELRRLDSDEVLAIVDNHKPMRLRVPAWFESQTMRDLVDPGVAKMMDEAFATDLAIDDRAGRRGLSRLIPSGRS